MKNKDDKKSKPDKKQVKIIQELEKKIEELTREKQELTDKFQRLGADYANHQKRTPKMISDSVAYEKKSILRSLLPSLDNFLLAINSAKNTDPTQGNEGIIQGVEMVFQHFTDALKSHGVEKIEAAGKPFDPSLHEAMMQQVNEDMEDGVVLEEFQAGYTLNGQVLRPAKVIVNKLPDKEAPSTEAEKEEDHQDSCHDQVVSEESLEE